MEKLKASTESAIGKEIKKLEAKIKALQEQLKNLKQMKKLLK